ncbi:23S rRNA methyltransferase [Pseudoalteromonas sp. NBT06-2]|uniref:class I SAM-dependent methyltransferase n=1 Tax=Pseudoalteromonas sp. NBT06-2 TaxID=2025950 RepID=UPI000BA711C8|nr:class I SAM-dependent methyltransferase [Pseudoalteromonas sp. NBT06-2]PAJ74162.1 23S rRNA methyltransferase [Pseudoalteromonas sp. NBT06-2]
MPNLINSQTKNAYFPLLKALSDSLNTQVNNLNEIEKQHSSLIDNKELCRIFHGRGHAFEELSHLNLDFYSPYLFLISYTDIEPNELEILTQLIWQHVEISKSINIKGLIYQQRAGRDTHTQIIHGKDPKSFEIQELGIKYQVELTKSQNTGIFPDMKMGRAWVKNHAIDAKVLNLFSYTCGFSLTAMAGGAKQVVNMDMNKGVLRTGKINHELNGFTRYVSFYPHDILKSFGKLKKLGPFDLVVVDPPSFQKGSFVLTKDYQKILRRLPEILMDKARLLLCANSPELSLQSFKNLISEHAGENFSFIERLVPAPNFVELDEDRSLKALVYQFNH